MEFQAASFEADFFQHNRDNLRQLFTGTAPIVIAGHGLVQRSADTTYPFQQDSNFWYLTGLNEPDLVLVMDKGKDYIILPDQGLTKQLFDGGLNEEFIQKTSGITTVLDNRAGWKTLSSRIKKAKHTATLATPPSYILSHGFYTNPSRRALITKIKSINPTIELLDLRDHLVKLRSIKQPQEIAAIQRAIDITGAAHKKVVAKAKSAAYEYEVEALITQVFRQADAVHGYQPIVANGINSCTLHYIQNNQPLNKKALLLLDVGAEFSHYSADITRTIALKSPTKRQKAVYQAVIDIQDYAFGQLRPGVDLRKYEEKVEKYVGEKLREIGLGKSISHEAIRRYYPHATSHFLGLDVHDVGQYDKPLASGMVLTVEPGIYIPEEEIGIRIEDDVLITDRGIEILSRRIPKRLW
ncbi:MAG: Xaa-Pro aminopeptidase [Candidatus Saccharibacteria bacterium]|nr:Xaa-Pro aminopeptidase [Candidatus Saccharibacteria bacterium]